MNENSDLIGPSTVFECLVSAEDSLEVRRIGKPGSKDAAISISTNVLEPDFDTSDELDDELTVCTIVLSTAATRVLIATLLNAVDEASASFTTILPWDDEEGSEL